MSSRYRPRVPLGTRLRNVTFYGFMSVVVPLVALAMIFTAMYAIITADPVDLARGHCATAYNPDRCVEMLLGTPQK